MHDSRQINALCTRVLDCAFEVHRTLGPGLLEIVYEEALCRELRTASIPYERQVSCVVFYKGESLDRFLTLDLIVDKTLILELKATEKDNALFAVQLLTYLRVTDLRVGYVVNFGQRFLKEGIHRVANGL